jgi:hypothetical protein
MRTLRHHFLPICCTAAFIATVWIVITLPLMAVFLFDKQFSLSDYLRFVVYAVVVAALVSVFVMFPLSLVLQHWLQHRKSLVITVPLFLSAAAFACMVGRFFLTGQFLGTLLSWPGWLFAFSVVFGVYWIILQIAVTLMPSSSSRQY